MKWFTKRVRGSIALFMSLIMLLLIVLEGFLIDGSKALAGKMKMSEAGDMALNAGLTYYDDALRKVYGLFAVSKTEAELKENLEKYFKETLGEATGSTDDTGYTDQFLTFINQSITAGWNEEQAGKLLDLSLTSFSASGLKNSALSEDYVIRNQILEYMKYRGPASLGYGMLEKIYAFKDLNKQQKVLETKLNYEESMDEVQQACEEAYTNLLTYNAVLNRLTPDHVEAESDAINKAIYAVVISTFALNAVKKEPQHQNKKLNKNWQSKVSDYSGHDVEAALKNCRNYRSLCDLYSDAFIPNLNGDQASRVTAAMQAIRLTVGYMEDFDNYRNLYTAWKNWKTYYVQRKQELEREIDNADEDDDTSDLEEELEDLEDQDELYDAIINGGSRDDGGEDEPGVTKILGTEGHAGVTSALSAAESMLKEDIDERMKLVTDKLHTLRVDAQNLEKTADLSKSSLESIIAKMDNLQGKGAAWQSAIDGLAAGDVKTSMQSDYDNKSKDLDRDKIRELETYLENGKAYGMELQNDINAVKAVNFNMAEAQGKGSYALYLNNNWNNSIYKSATELYTNRAFQTDSVSDNVKSANETGALTDLSVTMYMIDSFGGQSGSGKWQKMNLQTFRDKWNQTITTENVFFQYLERICPKQESQDSGEKEEATSTKEKLFEKAESVNFDVADVSSNQMDGSGDTKDFTSTGKDEQDKEVTKKAKENSKAASNFLENVGNLLAKGRDKMYISEYATEMFSYYTVDKPDGKTAEKTLSGYPFSEDRNYLYKAEVEYILWGNADPKADVRNTLTTIFGIRFLLNTLYAFTGDPEIRSTSLALATSIAGWTGFGVPLVQSVIIIGFALAETALDLQELKEGESVPIYKSTNTWTIKPSGMGREFKSQVGDAINRNAKKLENKIFEDLNTLTEDKIGEFNQKLTSYSNDKIDSIVDTASAAVLTPLEEQMIGLINVISPDESKISSALDNALAGVEQLINAEQDSVLKTAKQKAVSIMKSQGKARLVSTIKNVQNKKELTAGQISDQISQSLETCRSELKAGLKTTVSGSINSLTNELKSSIQAGTGKLQEVTSEKLDQYLMRIDCGVSFADIPSSGNSQKVHTSAADALTMDYSEYLWLFIAVTSMSSEQESKMLKRIGNLIEKNMTLSTNPDKSSNKNFKISQAYTFIGIEAEADLKTTFFALPVPTGTGGSKTYGPDKISLQYRGVLGY